MIRPCKENKLIGNLNEINNYITIRKKVKVITNTDRLLNLIKLYFESLLCYKKNHKGNHHIRLNGKMYLFEINGFNEKGEEVKKGFDEIGESLIKDILKDLKITLNKDSLTKYLEICNEIIESYNIDITYKISLLNAEGKVFEKQWQYLLFEIEEEIAFNSIQKRKEFTLYILTNKTDFLKPDLELNEKLNSIYGTYEFLIRAAIRLFIFHNHFDQIFKYIYKEFDYFHSISDEIELDDNRIVNFLLQNLLLNNNLFLIEKKEVIENYFRDNIEFLSDENIKTIENDLSLELQNFELTNASIELAEPSFEKIDVDKITTFISFTVSGYKLIEEKQIKLNENVNLELKKINNLYDDPIFKFLDSSELRINSFPFSIFSDSIGNTNDSISLNFIIKEFYHPDFSVIENGIKPIDFTEYDAKIGRKYYPHKEYIVELLRNLKKERKDEFPIEIELKNINIDLISNYYVSYHDSNLNLLYHKVHTITNLDSYIKIKDRFLTKLSELNLTNEIDDIRSLIFDTEIVSLVTLNKFIKKLLQIVVKKSIELRGVNKNLWKDSLPVKETEAQPIIFNFIKSIAEIKGIQISREMISANGSLDFHCSYTYNGKLLKTCIELKNAHHSDIIHGISVQLPKYIMDEGNGYGIFLVLWYKSGVFNKPTKFRDIANLKEELLKHIPEKLRIEIEIVDCTIKLPPSKKGKTTANIGS